MSLSFSVVIPSFNRKSFVVEAIDSVLRQDYPHFEVIVVDDASTDGSASLLKQRFQERIRLFQLKENRGVSGARNFGVAQAQFDWLCFLDSDDLWAPDKLKKTAEKLRQEPELKWLHCQEDWQRGGKNIKQPSKYRKQAGWIFEASLSLCSVGASCVAIHKSIFCDFDEGFPVCEDFDLWLKLSANHPIGLCDEALVVKRAGHPGQLSEGPELLDPWRLKSLLQLSDSPRISCEQRNLVMDAILKRLDILIRGGHKHNSDQAKLVQWISLYSKLENSFVLPDGRALNIIK